MPSLLTATASLGELELDSFWAPDDGRRNRTKHAEHWQ
jgi:hypothetical protein